MGGTTPTTGLTALNAHDFWNELTKGNISYAGAVTFQDGIVSEDNTQAIWNNGNPEGGAINTLGGIVSQLKIMSGDEIYAKNGFVSADGIRCDQKGEFGSVQVHSTNANSWSGETGSISAKKFRTETGSVTIENDKVNAGTVIAKFETPAVSQRAGLGHEVGGPGVFIDNSGISMMESRLGAKEVFAGSKVIVKAGGILDLIDATCIGGILDVCGVTISTDNGSLISLGSDGKVSADTVDADVVNVSDSLDCSMIECYGELNITASKGGNPTIEIDSQGIKLYSGTELEADDITVTQCTATHIDASSVTCDNNIDCSALDVNLIDATRITTHSMNVGDSVDLNTATVTTSLTVDNSKVGEEDITLHQGKVICEQVTAKKLQGNTLSLKTNSSPGVHHDVDGSHLEDLKMLLGPTTQTEYNDEFANDGSIMHHVARIGKSTGVIATQNQSKFTNINTQLINALNDVKNPTDGSGNPTAYKTNDISGQIITNASTAPIAQTIMELFNVLNQRMQYQWERLVGTSQAQNNIISSIVTTSVENKWADVSGSLRQDVNKLIEDVSNNANDISSNSSDIDDLDTSYNDIALKVATIQGNYITDASYTQILEDLSGARAELQADIDTKLDGCGNNTAHSLLLAIAQIENEYAAKAELDAAVAKLDLRHVLLNSTFQSVVNNRSTEYQTVLTALADISGQLNTIETTLVANNTTTIHDISAMVHEYNEIVDHLVDAFGLAEGDDQTSPTVYTDLLKIFVDEDNAPATDFSTITGQFTVIHRVLYWLNQHLAEKITDYNPQALIQGVLAELEEEEAE